ncbi:hypothetical protein [Amycolatopsis sp. MJM2582]|nr:hypothetical protein [Amycolatopsis sp. MJM2582]
MNASSRAAEILPEPPQLRRVFIGGDEIMVVFSPETMRDMGFGDTPFLH